MLFPVLRETLERRSFGWRCNISLTFFSVLTRTACCAGHEPRHGMRTTYGSKPCQVVFDQLSLLIHDLLFGGSKSFKTDAGDKEYLNFALVKILVSLLTYASMSAIIFLHHLEVQ